MKGKMLSVDDISKMSQEQIHELYRQGYTLEGAIQESGCQNCAAPGNVRALAGTCSGTITIVVPCIPNWQVGPWGPCQPDGTQTRTVTDLNNCGVTTGKPATSQLCTYIPPEVEANLTGCSFSPTIVNPGQQNVRVDLNFTPPNVDGNYILSGTISGVSFTSPTFYISAGRSSIWVNITIPSTVPAGISTYSISLTKV